jgi:peptidyl-prolyl cis-trans isomerase A (cyclophilin A)
MIRLRHLVPLLLAVAAPALAQPVPDAAPAAPAETPVPAPEAPPPPPPPPRPATVKVRLVTAAGPITLELEKARAPITTANFLRYVDQKRFDGTSFYRALKFPADTPLGLVQGGIRGAVKRSLPPIAHEPTTKTGLTHDNGAISMGRTTPGTAQGDFFIILGNLPALDANPDAKGDKDGYAVFGHVVEGLDTVIKILGSPVSPTAGEGAMKGQMIEKPVTITSAKRVP